MHTICALVTGVQTCALPISIRAQQEVAREETRLSASADLFDQMRSARREQAKIRTSAGEAGLSLNSGSIESLLMDSAMQMELQGDRTIRSEERRVGKSVSVRVDLGGSRIIKKKTINTKPSILTYIKSSNFKLICIEI